MKEKSIGVFDSGIGGLTVLNRLLKVLPNEKYVYIGDTLRIPYGSKSPEDIRKFSKQCIDIIARENLKAAVIACNTVSSYGLENLRKNFNFPFIGVIVPGSHDAVNVTKNKKIAILATDATVNSKVYDKNIEKLEPSIEVKSIGATDIVLAVENNHANDDIGKTVIKRYLDLLGDFDYDTLIFGCTHFPIAKKNFKNIFNEEGKKVFLVDPAYNTALELKKTLEKNEFLSTEKKGEVKFFVTDNPEKFKNSAIQIVDLPADKINPILVNPE